MIAAASCALVVVSVVVGVARGGESLLYPDNPTVDAGPLPRVSA